MKTIKFFALAAILTSAGITFGQEKEKVKQQEPVRNETSAKKPVTKTESQGLKKEVKMVPVQRSEMKKATPAKTSESPK